jgi:hypothetical protein
MTNSGIFWQKTPLVGQAIACQPDMLWWWKTHGSMYFTQIPQAKGLVKGCYDSYFNPHKF